MENKEYKNNQEEEIKKVDTESAAPTKDKNDSDENVEVEFDLSLIVFKAKGKLKGTNKSMIIGSLSLGSLIILVTIANILNH